MSKVLFCADGFDDNGNALTSRVETLTVQQYTTTKVIVSDANGMLRALHLNRCKVLAEESAAFLYG